MSASKAPSQLQLCSAALPQYQIGTFLLAYHTKTKKKKQIENCTINPRYCTQLCMPHLDHPKQITKRNTLIK